MTARLAALADADQEHPRARRGVLRPGADAAPAAAAAGAAGTPHVRTRSSAEARRDAAPTDGRGQPQTEHAHRPRRRIAGRKRAPAQMEAARTAHGADRAQRAEDPARRLQRAAARGSAWSTSGSTTSTCSPARAPTRIYLTEYERDAIRPHVLGKFRDLLGRDGARARRCCSTSTTGRAPTPKRRADGGEHRRRPRQPGDRGARPARRAAMPPARRGRAERRSAAAAARAQRELRARADGAAHARRRRRLHAEGRQRGRARVHRLDDRRPAPGRRLPLRAADARRRREDRARPHDQGRRRPEGRRAGARHPGARIPSTARFIATKLARRFVADEPPPALVDRAAATFRETDGDIREVVRDDRDVAGVLRRRGATARR